MFLFLYSFFLDNSWPTQPPKVTVSGSQVSATIPNLRPAQIYHVRILAENRLGLSEPSEIVQVSTLEEGKKLKNQ